MNGESYEKLISYLAQNSNKNIASVGSASEKIWTLWASELRKIPPTFTIYNLHFRDVSKYFQQNFHAVFLMSGESFEKRVFFLRAQSEQKWKPLRAPKARAKNFGPFGRKIWRILFNKFIKF